MVENLGPILLVEDDSVDAMTVKQAFNDLKIEKPLVHVTNGKEALDHLKDPANKKPCVILLDLSMPEMDGIQFLKIIKSDDLLKSIPVVVLTGSKQQEHKIEAFNLGVAGYVIKPDDYKSFTEAIETINMYWSFSEVPNI